MQITRLVVENLRAIERLELRLLDDAGLPRRRTVLLGVNGAGKTTILDAIAHIFLQLGARTSGLDGRSAGLSAADVRNVADPSLDRSTSLRQGSVVADVTLSENEQRWSRRHQRKTPWSGTVHFDVGAEATRDSFLLGDDDSPITTPVPRSGQLGHDYILGADEQEIDNETELFEIAARTAVLEAAAPCVLLPADRGVLETGDDLTLRQIRAFDPRANCLIRSRERFAPLATHLALASIASDGQRARSVKRMWSVLEKYFPALPRRAPERDGLLLRFRTESGATVPLTALSEGERALLLIFADLALRAPDGLVLVDELEQHLHPRWQRAALEALVALLPDAQFVLTTQSPYLASCVPDDVIELGDWKQHGE